MTIRKKTLTDNETFDIEMTSLENFIKLTQVPNNQGAKKFVDEFLNHSDIQKNEFYNTIENSLKNYIVYRIITFYETWVNRVLIDEYNEMINTGSKLPGEIWMSNFKQSPENLGFKIQELFKLKYGKDTDYKIFFILLDKGFELESNLQKILKDNKGWFNLFKTVNYDRNQITHYLYNYSLKIKPVDLFFIYREFSRIFPYFLKYFQYILNDNNISDECNKKWNDGCQEFMPDNNLSENEQKLFIKIESLTELKKIFQSEENNLNHRNNRTA